MSAETIYPQHGTRQEGTCWACGGTLQVHWHREYTGMAAIFAEYYAAETAAKSRQGIIGFNWSDYQKSNPTFTDENSVEVIDGHTCAKCGNIRFPQPNEERPIRWVATASECSACHYPIVDEQGQHPLEPNTWVHVCYSCSHCRTLFRELPPTE